MEKTITLECWTYKDDPPYLFRVDVPFTDTVTGLTEAIKRRRPAIFHDADLDLYSIPYPDEEIFEEVLKQWTCKGKVRLNGLKKVSTLEGYLIIVVPDSHNMAINFWVRGENTYTIHSIKVPKTETVAALRAAIKSKAQIDIRDAFVSLYKVRFPWATLEDALRGCTIPSLGTPLRDPEALSKVFTPQPTSDEVHVIVEGLVPFHCWFRGRGATNSYSLRVHVPMSGVVDDLRKAINAEYEGKSLPPDLTQFYQVQAGSNNGHFNELDFAEILGSNFGQPLNGCEVLSTIFGGVAISSLPLRVIIEVSERKKLETRTLSSAYPSGSIDDLPNDPIMQAREEFLRNAKMESPCSTAVPATFRDRQLDQNHRKSIPCGRPRQYEDIIPTVLLHPVFGRFIDDCHTIKATGEDYRFAKELADAMSDFYPNEARRAEAVVEVFATYKLDFVVRQIGQTEYFTDGDLRACGHCYMITKFRNETRFQNSEPYFQALGYYSELTRDSALEFARSPLPCFVLVIYGSMMVTAGAAWNLRPTAQLLTTHALLHFHSTDTGSRDVWARHLAALRQAAQSLKEYYENLIEPLLTSGPPPPHLFPHPTSYLSLQDGSLKRFHYVEGMSPRKLIFHGTVDTGIPVCIKFVRTYSRDAHTFLASLGCAPVLRGFEKIPGGWLMVVMDWLAPTDFENLHACTRKLPSSTFDDISTKLRSFHDAGYVHGDIRDANIMVSKSDGERFMIIDFDWAGNAGKARYPPRMNYADIQRPLGARALNEILAEHDVEMLSYVKSEYFV